MTTKVHQATIIFSMVCISFAAHAADMKSDISALAHQWAKVNYQTAKKDQHPAFEALIADAQHLVDTYPNRAEPLIWKAISLASEAKVDGGLSALGEVKEARTLLLAAEKINPNALDGSLYNTLGCLYAQVPGWPLGFGDKEIAAQYFAKSLAINPTGIDANYFYAQFLASEKDYAKALAYLDKASHAPNREGRADADAGRRQEIAQLINQIQHDHPELASGSTGR
jgi:tetratricopeptide (TPR) repeat protein